MIKTMFLFKSHMSHSQQCLSMLVFFLLGLFLSSGLCQTTGEIPGIIQTTPDTQVYTITYRVTEPSIIPEVTVTPSPPAQVSSTTTKPEIQKPPTSVGEADSATKPEITKSPSLVGEKSKAMCLEYSKYVFKSVYDTAKDEVLKFDTCKASEPLIVGGKNAEPNEFPHHVVLGAGNRKDIFWRGGGSLVSERFVLSAAHLISEGIMGLRWARIGDYNLTSTEDEAGSKSKSVTAEIQETIPHPKYKTLSFYNDIVLYRLKEDVELGEFIRPICLHTEFDIPKNSAIATGWGLTEHEGSRSDALQKVNLTIQSEEECTRMWSKARQNLSHGFDNSLMLCAGDIGKDACNEDSGGPLQLRLPEPYHCMYAQIGIVSFGFNCGIGVPGGFTRVSEYVSWIEETVWP